ncbi:MAG: glycosyltransferase family 4 protein [Nitrospirota bacterium]|nr:glycosyltransferase family 4 protein [Nitrospirota bacterium]MDE3219312.1 glycosyltransferase family 4 protein [Nitrospirota bacterium]
MNVLIVLPWDQEFGGVASVVGNVARQLEKKGHHVWFFHLGESDSLRAKVTKWNFPGYELNLRTPYVSDCPVKSVIGFSVYLCPTLYQLYTMLVRNNIDIVNIHYPISNGVYFTLLRKLLRFKLVISVHGADLLPKGIPEDRYPKPLQLLMNSADWLVAPSQSMLDAVLTKFPRLQTKASTIHNAVNMNEFELSGPGELQQGQYILCVALHQPRKAIDVLIKAFKIFSQTHTEVELWLVGDGPLRGQLEDLAQQLGLNEQVKFLGLQDRTGVRKLLRQCRFVVLPSRAEPFGIAILEALASGKPVVASAVGGIPEIIEDGKNGILVEPENPQALCDAMTTVWNDRELAERLASAGYATVKQHFQWDTAAARYEATFMKLIGQTNRPNVALNT